MTKKVFFLSDAHLGSLAFEDALDKERHLVRFLDSIKQEASAIYFLGDMFDFWFEYKEVVPKGFTRFLGKISELTDMGIEVHYLTGNHDMWVKDYFQRECGMTVHEGTLTTEIMGKRFLLSHGDGLGDPDPKFRLLSRIFHCRPLQTMFSWLHPDLSVAFGRAWAKHSRLKREGGREPDYMGEDKEYLVLYAKELVKEHSEIDYMIFGHRHIELDLSLPGGKRMMILGDWINYCTYAAFSPEDDMVMLSY